MASYYNKHEGDLFPGHIAKSSDINIIQQNIQDAIQNAIKDLTEGQSWILGPGDLSDENAFILTPDAKRNGRYIDQMNLAEGDDMQLLSIRQTSYRQPIKLSRSSLYSIIVKLQNKSEVSVPVNFELHDSNGDLIPKMKTVINVPENTDTPTEFEVIFDLDYYATAHGIEPKDLEEDNPELVNQNTDEESYENGVDYTDTETLKSSSAGASIIYLYIEGLNKNKQKAFDINNQEDSGYQWNDTDPTFGIAINKNSTYGQLLEENNGSGYILSSTPGDLYFKEIYANAPTYKCEVGEAIINGEKVMLADTHVSVGGASGYGNVLSYIYMDTEGHLKAENSDPFTGDEPATPIFVSEPHLHIADIITYVNDTSDPVIQQDDETLITRPRSHHERIRRLEKKMLYTQDVAIPTRIKYTLTSDDWIDPDPSDMLEPFHGQQGKIIDSIDKSGYVVTTNSKGDFVVKISEAKTTSLSLSLKSEEGGKVTTDKNKNKIIKTAQTSKYFDDFIYHDMRRSKAFAEVKNMVNNITEGTLKLDGTVEQKSNIVTNKADMLSDYNLWNDTIANLPGSYTQAAITSASKKVVVAAKNKKDIAKFKKAAAAAEKEVQEKVQKEAAKKAKTIAITGLNIKPTTRAYTIVSGQNGKRSNASEFPAMTFYTKTKKVLKKVEVPVYKFKNCTGVKFFIWQIKGPNNKKNKVQLEKKIYTSKVFSLAKAKVKNGYQYMEKGFLINFGKNGLTLSKGQYVLICLPIVKSGKGTVYVDTYKPGNPKDFCIRFYGAANASHFSVKERYNEIWYNPLTAVTETVRYNTSGYIVSGTTSWRQQEPIVSVKPIANLTIPDDTQANIYVDIGGGWKKVENKKTNKITGSGNGMSFRWKIEFKSNSKDTPVLKYDKKKQYAIKFEITRNKPSTSNLSGYKDLDKNLCLTSKMFDADKILREYIGDMNLAVQESKFSNYEFARIWGEDSEDKTMSIDIAGCDRVEDVTIQGKTFQYPVYSFHYVDLKLDDLPNTSVDYSNYDASLEEDEHNLRFKLDTENSYNDDEIQVISYKDFKLTNDKYEVEDSNNNSSTDTDEPEGFKVNLTKITESDENQVIAKANFDNPLDLSKYSGLKLGIAFDGEVGGTISGLGLYISSQNEVDAPSDLPNEDILQALEDGLPDLNSAQSDVVATYANKIIMDVANNNGTAVKVYYKSIWNSEEQKWEWQQIHDVKSYNIYELIDRSSKEDVLTLTEDNKNKEQFYEFEIDSQSVNSKYVQEIGLIVLCDEEKYTRDNVNTMTLTNFYAIKNDYYNIFSASDKTKFTVIDADDTPVVCREHGSLVVPTMKIITNSSTGVQTTTQGTPLSYTIPGTSSIEITHQEVKDAGEDLCYFDMTSKSIKDFTHIGIQIASDRLITKNMLELHLRKVDKNNIETTIEKIKIPTLNYIYYPGTTSGYMINLSQVIKKVKTTERFDKIVLYATDRFKNYAAKLTEGLTTTTGITDASKLSIYIKDICLYKAKTFPFLYPKMRMKIYLDDVDEISQDQIEIRKLGAVIQYK